MDKNKTVGIYETIITTALNEHLREVESNGLNVEKHEMHPEVISDRLAIHIGRSFDRALKKVAKEDRVEVAVYLVNSFFNKIKKEIVKSDIELDLVSAELKQLVGIYENNLSGHISKIKRPLTPLLDTTLLTNVRNEPRIGAQIQSEIISANRIDIVMAFVRMSGIRPFLRDLEVFCAKKGNRLRVLTTTYTDSTELSALKKLEGLGAEIKISYDTDSTRLHAKAWHFFRESGASTAFIGSSNLTYSAQRTGMEWNVRVSGIRNPEVIRKVESVFEGYWGNGDFVPFDAEEFSESLSKGKSSQDNFALPFFDLRLDPFQERLLEKINISRAEGLHKNLLVSATGTGKTVMAAVDYSRLKPTLANSKLLFVAHRKEILKQSMATFRLALGDSSFGELWVDGQRPVFDQHVFASIQSLSTADLDEWDKEHFGVVIVDEFHHAAAKSYEKLLKKLCPLELLGLTATPERLDGQSILHYFGDKITAEFRLWDAIEQQRLVPFEYYVINDQTDLTNVRWISGSGYQVSDLSHLYTANDIWANLVLRELNKRVDDLNSIKCLGFCVSVSHAKFMADFFSSKGVVSTAVSAETPNNERVKALQELRSGAIKVLFSVDLFNEGVDIPIVDTILLLRPTDSSTLFLQQLGRGLRKHVDKTHCTVVDFVGLHRKEFRYDRRLSALIGGGREHVKRQVETSFPYLPSGCHVEVDEVAKEIILQNIKNSLPDTWRKKVEEARLIKGRNGYLSLKLFLEESGLELEDIYTNSYCWSDMLDELNNIDLEMSRNEKYLRKAIGRQLHIRDSLRLDFYLSVLASPTRPQLSTLSRFEIRMLRMLLASLCATILNRDDRIEDALKLVWEHTQVKEELIELFELLKGYTDHLYKPIVGLKSDFPLLLHANYTRIEVLAALGVREEFLKVPEWREGVKWIPDEGLDVFMITVDKTEGYFSPTTSYKDYAISPNRIHWESQSSASSISNTGRRYINHLSEGSSVLIFARENTNSKSFIFLGRAYYVSHKSERPMQITWELQDEMPGDFYPIFASAIA